MKFKLNGLFIVLITIFISSTIAPVAVYAEPPQTCARILSTQLHGNNAVTELGANLPLAASINGIAEEKFRQLLENDSSFWLDECGRAFFVEQTPKNVSNSSITQSATIAYDQTFLLHSKPGSTKTIYLDFNGHSYSGTAWNSYFKVSSPYFAKGYSLDTNFSTFSTTEMDVIQSVWQRVSEDYASFDVDVTTEEPVAGILERSSSTDNTYGTRAVVTADSSMQRICSCGGVAYVGVFDLAGTSHETYQPAWIFTSGVGNGAKNITEALSHEVGHNLGLSHDGTSTLGYYQGVAGWAPLMGVGYYEGLTQWSKGEYPGANNKEDDYAVMAAHGAVTRVDEDSNSASSARSLSSTLSGIISSPTDKDWFVLTPGSTGSVTVTAAVGSVSPDLDIKLDIYSASDLFNPIATSNPAMIDTSTDVIGGLSASLTVSITAGDIYYAVIDGVGFGDLATTGYSDYGSVGNYNISISGGTTILAITTSSIPNANSGGSYSFQFTAAGGTPTYTWAAETELPIGLVLSSNGVISGTAPATTGVYTFTVRVTDSVGTFISKSMSLNVILPPLAIATNSLPSAAFKKSYSASLAATGGSPSYTWGVISGILPKGLTMSNTGTITGTPTVRGTFTITVRVTDIANAFAEKSLSIKVN